MNKVDKLILYIKLIAVEKKVDIEEFASLAKLLNKDEVNEILAKLLKEEYQIRRDVVKARNDEITEYLKAINKSDIKFDSDLLKYPSLNKSEIKCFDKLMVDNELDDKIKEEIRNKLWKREEITKFRNLNGKCDRVNFNLIGKNVCFFVDAKKPVNNKIIKQLIRKRKR